MLRLTMILIAALGLEQQDDSRCQPTSDLLIEGAVIHQEADEAELTGSIFNSSDKEDYENIYVKADFFDDSHLKVGEFTFTLKDEAEVNQTIPFRVEIADADQVQNVEFTVVCAEVDRKWWPL